MTDTVAMGLLLGGRSQRMGMDKATLCYDGLPAWQTIGAVLQSCGPVYLSCQQKEPYLQGASYPVVTDLMPGCGPLGGLYSLLKAVREDSLFLCACDMPNMSVDFIRHLIFQMQQHPDCDGVLVRDALGRLYPTAGIYKKTMLSRVESAILSGQYKMSVPIFEGSFFFVPEDSLSEALRGALLNINTQSEFQTYRDSGKYQKKGRCENE